MGSDQNGQPQIARVSINDLLERMRSQPVNPPPQRVTMRLDAYNRPDNRPTKRKIKQGHSGGSRYKTNPHTRRKRHLKHNRRNKSGQRRHKKKC